MSASVTPLSEGDPAGVTRQPARRIDALGEHPVTPLVAAEEAVALVFNGIAHGVMMASPTDLEDFALGFALSEGIILDPAELLAVEAVPASAGIELQIRLTARRAAGLADRRRRLVGPSGCGLCGIEELAAARRPLAPLQSDTRIALDAVRQGLAGLGAWQPLNRLAGALHAAAWCDPDGRILAAAEDVGRHNALDKLIGALARRPGGRPDGALLLTSRCSYELVAKAVTVGIPLLAAISAPTRLAIETAEATGLGLAALARADAITLYAHAERFLRPASATPGILVARAR